MLIGLPDPINVTSNHTHTARPRSTSMAAPARNQPCPCGSKKKFKHCCANIPPAAQAIRTENGQMLTPSQAIKYAIELHKAGRLRKADAVYQQILHAQPAHADALHLSGLAKHQLSRHEQAYGLINKAITINPYAAQFHNNLGEVCRALNRTDEALACYGRALTLDPELVEAHRNIGLTHLASDKTDEAVSVLQTAMARFPDQPGIHWALCQALMRQGRPAAAVEVCDKGLASRLTDPALLCAKGIALKAAGNLDGAIEHYQDAIRLQPHVPELHHNLALAYQQHGNVEGAIASLEEELKLSPNAESARHLLAALQRITTERAPATYVRETFDGYADNFDEHLVSKLGYKAPESLAKMLQNALGAAPEAFNVLDLGCGTGLFGEEIRDLKKRLIGVDLSPRMIEKARQRQIYDELVVGDILDYLAEARAGKIDLIAAADVFIYVGNLLPIFEHASRALEPGGWFAFSIETPPPGSGDFVLDATGRYQHGQDYLARLSTEFGFTTALASESCLRKEKDKAVPGFLYLLKKV